MQKKQNGTRVAFVVLCVGTLLFLISNYQPSPRIQSVSSTDIITDDATINKKFFPLAQVADGFKAPVKLTQHNLSVCLKHSDHGPYPPPYLAMDNDAEIQQRIQCLCLEKQQPRDNINCIMRVRNVLVKRHFGSQTADIILQNCSHEFAGQVTNAGSPFSYINVHVKAIKGLHEISTKQQPSPPVIDRTDRPVLMVPIIIWVNGHYHAIIGPTGTLQAVTTRDIINSYYAANEATEGVKATTGSTVMHRYNENSSGVALAGAGSCSLMNFDAPDRLVIGEDSLSTTPPPPVQPTYLSREMIFIDDLGDRNLPRVGTLDWFARRLGFCYSEVPEDSYTLVDDLWVNMATNQVGTQYRLRRNDTVIHPTPEHMTGKDYLNHCKLTTEEMKAARWSASRIKSLFKEITPILDTTGNNASEFSRKCIPLRRSKIVDGKIVIPPTVTPKVLSGRLVVPEKGQICAMVIGRKVNDDPGTFRVRGVPPNIEIAILEALLLPVEATKEDNTFHDQLRGINIKSGAEACGAETKEPYEFVKYPNSSNAFPAHAVTRSEIEHLSMPHQYAQIRAANLFIIEEGAPLVWSLVASMGSTFIVVYYSHHSRKEHKWGFEPHTDYFAHIPQLTGSSRFIFFVIQRGVIPSFAALREAYDRPWAAETLIVMCEGVKTHITARGDFNSGC